MILRALRARRAINFFCRADWARGGQKQVVASMSWACDATEKKGSGRRVDTRAGSVTLIAPLGASTGASEGGLPTRLQVNSVRVSRY